MNSLSLAYSTDACVSENITLYDEKGVAYRYVCEQLQSLTNLGPNWDGYNALPPTNEAILATIMLAGGMFGISTPRPDVFPVPNGSIQIEWSCFNLEIEVEVVRNDEFFLFAEDLVSGEIKEEKLDINLSSISELMKTLHERAGGNIANLAVVN